MCIANANSKQILADADCVIITETHHSAVFHIALGNPKFRIFNMHLMHPLIFEYPPVQSLPPFEQSVC